ncbi:restriction endonuclease subunit S [uncultured Sulfuricurvum sp.]|mgnify:CR=1 FL=1|uniref:restriction endonuclease subunit S n=1 Tax=uncultured Sulfuricurvum sp. TaxID=430693 RepID=UPI0026364D80|nr:restriction endonuclease subunit S [uncultured Sulfuricurvum sp.]
MSIREGYKQTEVGVIPEEWKVVLLEDIAAFKNGKGHEQFIDENGQFIVINSKFISTDGEVHKSSNENLSPLIIGDIAMVMSDIPNGRALAKCFLVKTNNKYTLNQRICSLTPKKDDSLFLYYMLNRNPYFLKFNDGVNQTNLRKNEVLECKIPLPPLPEQQKIAEILSTVDQKIDSIDSKIEETQTLKRGLMQRLLSEGIGHSEFKESEIGRIPMGWEVTRISDLATVNPESLSNSTEPNLEIEYIDIASIQQTGTIATTNMFLFSEAPSRARRLVKQNDVLLSTVRPNLKSFAIVKEKKENLVCSTGYAVLRSKEQTYYEYIYQFLLTDLFMDQVNKMLVGSNYPAINNDDVKKILIPFPPLDEQKQIAEILSTTDEKLETLRTKKEAFETLKKGLMQKLLSGEVRVNP